MSGSEGILAYGYDLGGPETWKLKNASEYGYYDFPWLTDFDEDDWEETAYQVLLAKIVGFTETLEQAYQKGTNKTFHERKDAALKKLRVQIVRYGYGPGDQIDFILATTAFEVDDYGSEVIDISFDHAAAGILDVALAALEITPLQEEPKWILASYYGG
jgi:hypothetical protein